MITSNPAFADCELKTADWGLPTESCRLIMSGPRLESRGYSICLAWKASFLRSCKRKTCNSRLKTANWRLWTEDCGLKTALCRLNISSRILIICDHEVTPLFVVSEFKGTLGCQLILKHLSIVQSYRSSLSHTAVLTLALLTLALLLMAHMVLALSLIHISEPTRPY